MKSITQHEFIEHESGDLALILDLISADVAKDPVLLVSRIEDKAYLRRAPHEVHEIIGINPKVIDRVRASENMIILEMLGDKVVHGYDVPTAPFEKEDPANTGT